MDEIDLCCRVGANLRSIRRARGMSQQELGRAIGVHRTLIGAIERGNRNLSLRSVERLAAKLDVDVRRLFDDRDQPLAPPVAFSGLSGIGPTKLRQDAICVQVETDR